MDALKHIVSDCAKAELPKIEIGDTVKVHVWIKEGEKKRIQVFEGTVIAKKHGGISETFTVRRVAPVSYTHLDVYKRQAFRRGAG